MRKIIMNKKMKILILVFIIGLVLISGLLIWNNQITEKSHFEYIKDLRYCENKNDCKYFENCLIPSGIDNVGDTIYVFEGCFNLTSDNVYCNYEREDYFCKCINNICTIEK